VAGGLAEDRVLRVQGLASSQPFDEKDPLAPTNRRISIIVMNRDAEDRVFKPQVAAKAADDEGPNATNYPPGAPTASSAPAP
jgi:chemotaxis protein MotB